MTSPRHGQRFSVCGAQVMTWKEWREEQSKADAKIQALTSDVQALQARVDALQAVIVIPHRNDCHPAWQTRRHMSVMACLCPRAVLHCALTRTRARLCTGM